MRYDYDKYEYVKEREKNAVFIGFSEEDRKRNSFMPGREYLADEREAVFPKIFYYDSENDASRLHGYCVFIKVGFDFNYIKNNYIKLDKVYRKKYRYFKNVILYSELFSEGIDFNFGKYSNLELVDKYTLYDYNYFDCIFEKYREYCINFESRRYSKPKLKRIQKIRNVLKDRKEISTKELVLLTNFNERTIQRYMHDINSIYNEIGYDETKNIWYNV